MANKNHKNCKHCGHEVAKDMYHEWYHVGTRHYLCDLKDKQSKVAEWP
jgi:hypothetical protein